MEKKKKKRAFFLLGYFQRKIDVHFVRCYAFFIFVVHNALKKGFKSEESNLTMNKLSG